MTSVVNILETFSSVGQREKRVCNFSKINCRMAIIDINSQDLSTCMKKKLL